MLLGCLIFLSFLTIAQKEEIKLDSIFFYQRNLPSKYVSYKKVYNYNHNDTLSKSTHYTSATRYLADTITNNQWVSNQDLYEHSYIIDKQTKDGQKVIEIMNGDESILHFNTFGYFSENDSTQLETTIKNGLQYSEKDGNKLNLLKNKYDYLYDAKGNISQLIKYDFKENQWVFNSISYRNSMTYDDKNNLIELVSERYKEDQWSNDFKNVYEYNEANQLVSKIKYVTDGLNWIENEKVTYEFISNDVQEVILYQYENGLLSNKNKKTYTYNQNYFENDSAYVNRLVDHVYLLDDYNLQIDNSILLAFKEEAWNDNEQIWNIDRQYLYFYSTDNNEVVSANDVFVQKEDRRAKLQITVFPNPAQTSIRINTNTFANFELYNLLGEIVLTQEVTEETQVDISSLQQGVYLYNIHSTIETVKGKLIIE